MRKVFVAFLVIVSFSTAGFDLSAQQGVRTRTTLPEASSQDTHWRQSKLTERPLTKKEMDNAIAADMPEVWGDVSFDRPRSKASRTPMATPGGLPGDDPRISREFETDLGAKGDSVTSGFDYPPPFTRYETFPSYTNFPHKTVGKVFFKKPGDSRTWSCSASSIGGDGVITAAHCVRDGSTGTWWTNWSFVPAFKNGAKPYGQWTVDHLWVQGGWVDGGNGDHDYDIGGAVLTRKSGRKISQTLGWLGFAWNQNEENHWTLLGYPVDPPFNGNLQQICHSSYAYSAGFFGGGPIAVGCDQTGGASGGPWILKYAGNAAANNYVNGVNSYRRCLNSGCTQLYTFELFSPEFDNSTKLLKDCIVNSVPGNAADPNQNCAPGT